METPITELKPDEPESPSSTQSEERIAQDPKPFAVRSSATYPIKSFPAGNTTTNIRNEWMGTSIFFVEDNLALQKAVSRCVPTHELTRY